MNAHIKEMTCIICPKGCHMVVQMSNGNEPVDVAGNGCERGAFYAKAEILHPMRTLTTTLKTNNPEYPRISVKTSGPIAKEQILIAMHNLNQITVKLPVTIGDVIIENFLNLKVDIIATMTFKKE